MEAMALTSLGPLVNNSGGGPKQPRQGILALMHLDTAAAPGGRTAADYPLLQKALLRVGDNLVGAVNPGYLLFLFYPVALITECLIRGNYCPHRGQLTGSKERRPASR